MVLHILFPQLVFAFKKVTYLITIAASANTRFLLLNSICYVSKTNIHYVMRN